MAYIIGTMNMILHGVEAPNIVHTNTLAENISDIQEKDRFDIVLANPPFGGKERAEIQQNFPIKTGETAYLFLQHFIKIMKAGGKAGIVIKNTFLSNTDNASVSLRKLILESCNLHTILDMPGGTFTGAGVKTVVLFFEKGTPTKSIWYYQLNLDRNLGKTNPLNEADLADFVALKENRSVSENSWTVDISDVDQRVYDISVRNPKRNEVVALRTPEELIEALSELDVEGSQVIEKIRELNALLEKIDDDREGWQDKRLEELCTIARGGSPRPIKDYLTNDPDGINWIKIGDATGNGKYIYKTAEKIKPSGVSKSRMVHEGDFLLSNSMSFGHPYILKTSGCVHDGWLVLSEYSESLDQDFLYHLLGSKLVYDQFDRMAAGSTVRNLNKELAGRVIIPVPPMTKQREMAKYLDLLAEEKSRLEGVYLRKAETLNELQESIIGKALLS